MSKITTLESLHGVWSVTMLRVAPDTTVHTVASQLVPVVGDPDPAGPQPDEEQCDRDHDQGQGNPPAASGQPDIDAEYGRDPKEGATAGQDKDFKAVVAAWLTTAIKWILDPLWLTRRHPRSGTRNSRCTNSNAAPDSTGHCSSTAIGTQILPCVLLPLCVRLPRKPD
eukprot:3842251-Pyramimonas_sp.AAC.1